ncbi:MAG: IS30 family transposase [Bacilli bacterium]
MAHLTESHRIKIEHYLNENYSYRKIAELLNVNVSTISREVKRNIRTYSISNHMVVVECIHKDNCERLKGTSKSKMCSINCPDYELRKCDRFSTKNAKPVCNSCPNNAKCKLARKKYIANVANNKYELRILLRPKIRITQEQFDFINKLFSEKMTKGQSISVIYQNHKDEIMISENTVRNYLKRGLLKSNQLDMIRPRFTANKSVKRRVIKNVDLLNGRTYEDFINYTKEKDILIVQLDTVVGKLVDNKKILTIHWPSFHFQIGILLEKLSPAFVNNALMELKNKLGLETYKILFQVILTDNGIEFSLLDEIENDENGELITKVFFCDPYKSSQKGSCERNHEFIRYVLPKGVSFDNLNQKDVDLIFSHINSTPRNSLGFKTPFELFKTAFGIEVLRILNINEINKDDVHLKPKLIK